MPHKLIIKGRTGTVSFIAIQIPSIVVATLKTPKELRFILQISVHGNSRVIGTKRFSFGRKRILSMSLTTMGNR